MVPNVINRFVNQFVEFGLRDIFQFCRGRIDPLLQAVRQFRSLGADRSLVRKVGHYADMLFRLERTPQEAFDGLPDVRRKVTGLLKHAAGHGELLRGYTLPLYRLAASEKHALCGLGVNMASKRPSRDRVPAPGRPLRWTGGLRCASYPRGGSDFNPLEVECLSVPGEGTASL